MDQASKDHNSFHWHGGYAYSFLGTRKGASKRTLLVIDVCLH